MNPYNTRSWGAGIPLEDDPQETEAVSSPGQYSSPYSSTTELPSSELDGIPFGDLPDLPEDLEGDFEYMEPRLASTRSSLMTLEHKTWLALQWISSLPHFSFSTLILTMFRSDSPVMTAYSNKFLAEKHHIQVMELWLNGKGDGEPKKVKDSVKAGRAASSAWVIRSAAGICAREASFVTDRASSGPFKEEAASLRIPASCVTVETMRGFRVSSLLAIYQRTLPRLQEILRAVIGKEGKPLLEGSRDPAHGQTLATSILLNLRSRRTNYHACMNAFFCWDNRVSKRFISAMNHYGVTSSYEYQCRAILSLSEDSVTQARAAANDPTKIKLLPYDNFNWVKKTHEASALHGSIQHDQVSALLVIIPPVGEGVEGMPASEIMSVESLKPTESKRHDLHPRKSLTDILPSLEDHNEFRQSAILHVARILVDEISSLKDFAPQIWVVHFGTSLNRERMGKPRLPE